MALDGAMISLLRRELAEKAVDSRVDKIHMPSREEIVIALHGPTGNFRLLLSAKGSGARANITAHAAENPKQPPMFCMLLRKHIGSAKLIDIRQPDLERILFFDFSGYNEFGDPVVITLALEMMGRHSNIVLIAPDSRIIDAARRIDGSISSVRLVLPGLYYELPPPRGRFNLLADRPADMVLATAGPDRDMSLGDCLMDILQGVSPVLAREIAFNCTGDIDTLCYSLTAEQKQALGDRLSALQATLRENNGTPVVLSEPEGKLRDITFVPVHQYGVRMGMTPCASYSELLDRFYSARDTADRFKQRSGDLLRLVTTRRDRIARRIAAQSQEIEESLGRDHLRYMGDILSANLYAIQPGMGSIVLDNFYDPGDSPITIALDPKLTPSQNAQHYYAAYRKADTSFKKLTELVREGELELAYIESVLDNLTRARSEEEYEAIRQELAENGVIRRRNMSKKQQKSKLKPIAYRSSDGFLIYSGHNNLENEAITFKDAGKQDIWFHAQKVPGSHTVVFTEGKSVPNKTLEEAAVIAAYNSRLRDSSKVAVDYTPVRNVKKIHGAGPGMVIYDPYETAIVDPDAVLVGRLEAAAKAK